MKNSFLNIGNKAFMNTDKVICIVVADSDKVRCILARDNLKRTGPKVIDTTSAEETHFKFISVIIIIAFQASTQVS